jgi:acetylornithine deacetylase/succinyl-diaminopimelate desuccinylase-like protein
VHLAALLAHGGLLPVSVTVLVDGEEEIGSPTISRFLSSQVSRLAADVVVLADSANLTADIPAVTTSLRGGVNVTVEVRTLDHGVHSGLYGGPVPDALTALCRLLATLHDERGDVAVPGLAAGGVGPLGLSEEELRADAGVLDGVQLIGSGSLAERLWAKPAIAITGIDAPAVKTASNTLVPAAREGQPSARSRRRPVGRLRGTGGSPRIACAMGRAGHPEARQQGRALRRSRRRQGVCGRPSRPGRGVGETRC